MSSDQPTRVTLTYLVKLKGAAGCSDKYVFMCKEHLGNHEVRNEVVISAMLWNNSPTLCNYCSEERHNRTERQKETDSRHTERSKNNQKGNSNYASTSIPKQSMDSDVLYSDYMDAAMLTALSNIQVEAIQILDHAMSRLADLDIFYHSLMRKAHM